MISRRNWSRGLLGLIFWAGFGTEALSRDALRLVGSDQLGSGFISVVKQFAEERGMVIEMDLQGSLSGRRELEEGRAEVALISMSPRDEEFSTEFSSDPLAYHVTFLWVRSELSLPRLSYGQLAELFRDETTGSRKRWRDYGAQGEGGSRLAAPGEADVASRLSVALLEHKLGLSITSSFQGLPDSSGQEKLSGILIRALPPEPDGRWESVPVAINQAGRAYPPTDMNVYRGDYPLSWPLRLVFRRNQVESLYPLLRFLLEDRVARELREAGMIPLPEMIRRERMFNLERL